MYMIKYNGKNGFPCFMCNLFKKILINMGIGLCNRVPDNIINLNKYKTFKIKWISSMMNHVFYSIDEFISYGWDNMQEKDRYI
jgi:hypothetical protein